MPGDIYDIEGYSITEDIIKNEKCYSLQYHELKSIAEIKDALENNSQGKGQLEGYISYLEHLELKLSTIIMTEEKEGLPNISLKNDLRSIRNLKEMAIQMLQKPIMMTERRGG